VLTIAGLRQLASTLTTEKFAQQLGPFVLVQRPPEEGTPISASGPTTVGAANQIAARAVALLFMFDELTVATLPPLRSEDVLAVGRLPDCDLIIKDDSSVSKRHAQLIWDGKGCTVVDLQSTNGTFLNTGARIHDRMLLRDGDILSFGDAQFWYLLTETLHQKLRSYGPTGLGSYTG
jgi:pSer/pThr/pTyr-binding forkhead associated (FHA) protein